MRIIYLNYEFPPIGGGGSPVSYEIAKDYVKRGHHVDVVTMKYKDLPEYEEKDGMHIYRVPCLRARSEICHPWEQLTYLISARSFLKKKFKTTKYDVCHAHFIIPTGPLALWMKRRYGIPYVLTAHGSDVLGHNKRFAMLYPLLRLPWVRVISEARCLTAPSDYLRDSVRKITDKGNVVIVPNGLNMSQFRPMKKQKRILVVARLFINKGVQDVLAALQGLDLGKWHVDIVGDGPYRVQLENKCKEYGLSGVVSFHGWMDFGSNALCELYGISSIFISASHFESFGQTVIEAISAGCYPLLSDIGGHRFIVNDDRFYFKTGDLIELRKRIKNLISKKLLKQSINIKRFSWDYIIKQYISIMTDNESKALSDN